MSLAQEIEELQSSMQAHIPAPVLEQLLGAIQRLVDSGLADRALGEGQAFPIATLVDADGNAVELAKMFNQGNTVVSFFRGSWCPYCTVEMAAWRKQLPAIQARGGQLIAVSPMAVDKTASYAAEVAPDFPVLSDPGNLLASSLGLVFELELQLRQIYTDFGFALPDFNGDDSWQLPIPATYVVDQQGIIRYRHIDADYSARAEPETVIEHL